MRVLSTFDNSQSVNPKAREQREKGATATQPGKQAAAGTPANQAPPSRENLSRSQILARLEQSKNPSSEQAQTKATERHALLAKPLWDDAGEEEGKAVHLKALENAKNLSGVNTEPTAEKPKAAEEIKTDVAKNEPESEETRSKLKHLLSSGGFQFNDKEKQALSQILVA